MATVQVSMAGAMGPPGPPGSTLTTTTEARPVPGTRVVGEAFFDTTLNKPIWVNADKTGYVDSTGTVV